jgi:recombination protein RecT
LTELVSLRQKVETFRGLLEKMKPQLAHALPSHVRADRMARVVLTSVQRVPQLLDCTQTSLLACIVQASQLGLEPDGLLGHAYLIPYGKTCQLVVGYKGLIKLARQSGELSTIHAAAVHVKDAWAYHRGDAEQILHTPAMRPLTADGKPDMEWDPGPLVAVYAIARLKDGSVQREVMDAGDVEKIRRRSKAANHGPWVTDFEEMAKKTVLRRLCKTLPASVELQKAVTLDEQVDAGLHQELEIEVAAEPVQGGAPQTLEDLTREQEPASA